MENLPKSSKISNGENSCNLNILPHIEEFRKLEGFDSKSPG